AVRLICQVLYGLVDWMWRGAFGFCSQRFCARATTCLNAFKVISRKLHRLASLPTVTPESAGLCALGPLGNLIRVTDGQ
ncbi:hypothetical protein KW849_31005, partial [Pseudomonas sp. PDM26]|uniref:hypothetical protein n=1 Tax=Pseudomonas sp. PDM26 TaxID=2854766 RepID=UPI001C48B718